MKRRIIRNMNRVRGISKALAKVFTLKRAAAKRLRQKARGIVYLMHRQWRLGPWSVLHV